MSDNISYENLKNNCSLCLLLNIWDFFKMLLGLWFNLKKIKYVVIMILCYLNICVNKSCNFIYFEELGSLLWEVWGKIFKLFFEGKEFGLLLLK